MSDYRTLKLTWNELEEIRIAAEVQLESRRADIRASEWKQNSDESQQYRALERAHQKVTAALGDLA